MDKSVPLSVYMDNNRPLIPDLLNIYIAVLECIDSGKDEGVIFHIEYIRYDCSRSRVYLPANRFVKGNEKNRSTPGDLFNDMRTALRYADSKTQNLADNVIKMYDGNGCRECLNMLKDYRKRLNKSHRLITWGGLLFVFVVLLIVIMYYRVYGICFY